MQATRFRLGGLLVVLLTVGAGTAWGQPAGSPSPPDPQWPIPTGNGVDGGFYTAASFLYFQQSNPLGKQPIAYKGFLDVDGTASGGVPNTFHGSGTVALEAKDASGPLTYVPGMKIDLGWRFSGEMEASTLTFSWLYFTEAKYNAGVTLADPWLNQGPGGANSFFFSPVYNFPNNYAGPPSKLGVGDAGAAFGIWNGASEDLIQFIQKTQQWDLTYRMPFYSTETYRLSGLAGGRFLWLWEQFQWTAIDLTTTGTTPQFGSAVYNNIVSNRMYGPVIGCSQEWYLGSGFAANLDLGTAAFFDYVRELIRYEFADRTAGPQSKLGRRDFSIAVQFTANAGINWYPYQGVQVRAGYNLWLLLNSIAAEDPINYNWQAPAYQYAHVARIFDGFDVGLAFIW